jgi:prophage regulatory protein
MKKEEKEGHGKMNRKDQVLIPERVIRKPELFMRVGLSDATIWRLEKLGRFPGRLRLGGHSCGWLESELLAWLEKKADARRSTSDDSGEAAK